MPKQGDFVAVHYHGTLDDGTVFDSSRERVPLTFVIGSGQVIPGFDSAALSLEVGRSVTVRLEGDEAYGKSDPALIFEVPVDETPEPLSVGDRVELMNGAPAVVTSVTDKIVTIDANHPLAGQALTFEIELMSIEDA
jgi:FKBP-type peptidyl-prolyl cis-trans isomerase 2